MGFLVHLKVLGISLNHVKTFPPLLISSCIYLTLWQLRLFAVKSHVALPSLLSCLHAATLANVYISEIHF